MTNIYKPLQLQAYDLIKESIENGELEFETTYSEAYFSNKLGFSKAPIKSAIVRLSNEKMVDIIPSKGIVLHKVTSEDLKNSLEMRCAIESYCAFILSQGKASASGRRIIKKLDQLLKATYEDVQKCDIDTFAEHDMEWHKTIISFPNNKDFIDFFSNYSYITKTLMKKVLFTEGRLPDAYHEHKAIYEALLSDNPLSAFSSASYHLNVTQNILKEKNMIN
ncbi:MAG: GntR family transcriptional regulator [Eubacteriales bacterium]|nr:GntR family transcriptional regulator [Eubacteriales bacterium]